MKKLLLTTTSIAVMFSVSNSYADENAKASVVPTVKPANPSITELQDALSEQQEKIAAQAMQLEEQRKIIEALQQQVGSIIQAQQVADESLEQYRATGVEESTVSTAVGDEQPVNNATEAINTADTDPAKTSVEDKPESEVVGIDRKQKEKEKPPEVAALESEGASVLLGKGRMVIQPSLEYSRFSSLRVAVEGFTIVPALNIGSFDITEVDRDTLTGALTARLGISDRIELETRVPYLYRDDSTLSRPVGVGAASDELRNVSGNGLGDVEVSARYQINSGQNGWPFFIGNLSFKSRTGKDPFEVPLDTNGIQTELPTGSGFYSVQPGITAIFPSDPVVFFSNLGYTHTFKRDVGGTFGEIDPGDSISFGMGMGFSANERASFSLGYSHDTVFKTKQNGATIPNSDVLQAGKLNLGFAYRLNKMTNLNFNISAGLTQDAPDVQLIFRVPMTFDLFR